MIQVLAFLSKYRFERNATIKRGMKGKTNIYLLLPLKTKHLF